MMKKGKNLEIENLSFNAEKRKFWEEHRFVYSAMIELTSKCNMNCVHCYLNHHHSDADMTYEQVIDIIDLLYDKGVLFLTFTGGEIFARKDFTDIYMYAKKKGFLIELFTNGVLLTDEIIDMLKKYPPVLVDVSLYGACEETYHKVTRCNNLFDIVIHNVQMMVRENIRVALRTPVLADTLSELDDMKKLAGEIGVPFNTSFEILATIDRNRETQQYQVKTEEILLYETLEYFDRTDRACVIHNSASGGSYPLFECNIGKGGLVIDYQENMFPCMKFRHIKDKVNQENFDSLWDSYEKFSHIMTRPDNKCNQCDARYYCEVCPAEMDFLYGDMEYRTDEMCKIARYRKRLYEGEFSLDMAKEILSHWE